MSPPLSPPLHVPQSVRVAALTLLTALSSLGDLCPLLGARADVLAAVREFGLDDHKRAVRRVAARCVNAWIALQV